MVKFKKGVENILPYDRGHYINCLADDFNSFTEWKGISFQLDENMDLTKKIEVYEKFLKNIISGFDNSTNWIVNHDDKDLKWFRNEGDDLISLRSLFKKNHVQSTYKGALIFTKDELFACAKDLILYPSGSPGLCYKNLDISHEKLSFIIKISGHLNIDLLSVNKEFLKKFADENTSNAFNIIEYRGTSLFH